MCLELNVAAEIPIPQLDGSNSKVATYAIGTYPSFDGIFSLPHRAFVTPHDSCACYFSFAEWDEDEFIGVFDGDGQLYDAGPEIQHRTAGGSVGVWHLEQFHHEGAGVNLNHLGLADFLDSLLAESDKVELMGCWEGDWDRPIEKRVTITPDDLRHPHFFIYTHYVYTVVKPDQLANG